jgi:hypothetical protein
MAKPTLISDVRSVLHRSLPESPVHGAGFQPAPSSRNLAESSQLPETSPIHRVHQVMQSLQPATAPRHLFPGTSLVLAAQQAQFEPEKTAKGRSLQEELVIRRDVFSGDLASIIRLAFLDECNGSIPFVAETLLEELKVIERRDRSYYVAESHDEDAVAAYCHRQKRRKDILARLLKLKRIAR